jgi:hypothetical protein
MWTVLVYPGSPCVAYLGRPRFICLIPTYLIQKLPLLVRLHISFCNCLVIPHYTAGIITMASTTIPQVCIGPWFRKRRVCAVRIVLGELIVHPSVTAVVPEHARCRQVQKDHESFNAHRPLRELCRRCHGSAMEYSLGNNLRISGYFLCRRCSWAVGACIRCWPSACCLNRLLGQLRGQMPSPFE